MIGWIKNQPTMCAPKQSKWCVVSEAVVLSPNLQWCGWLRTHPSLLRNGVAAPLLFSIWMAPFLLQNGAAAPLYALKHPLSLVWLSISPQTATSNPPRFRSSFRQGGRRSGRRFGGIPSSKDQRFMNISIVGAARVVSKVGNQTFVISWRLLVWKTMTPVILVRS